MSQNLGPKPMSSTLRTPRSSFSAKTVRVPTGLNILHIQTPQGDPAEDEQSFLTTQCRLDKHAEEKEVRPAKLGKAHTMAMYPKDGPTGSRSESEPRKSSKRKSPIPKISHPDREARMSGAGTACGWINEPIASKHSHKR